LDGLTVKDERDAHRYVMEVFGKMGKKSQKLVNKSSYSVIRKSDGEFYFSDTCIANASRTNFLIQPYVH